VKPVDPKSYIDKIVDVEIDRPLGSRHPEHKYIFFTINYGFVPNVPAPDRDFLDVYILGVFEPLESFTGRCIAVVHRLDDDDDKLVVVPEGKNYSDEQITALTEFLERFHTSEIIR
jgi:inorganic pyrophosphatase